MKQTTHHMKKMLLSVTFLLSLVSITKAADTKQTALNNTVENNKSFTSATSSTAVANYAAVMEENTRLRMEAAELSSKVENLVSMLDYSHMMHATISNLKNVSMVDVVEDAKSQMEYAQMMNAVLVNLVSVNVLNK
jgi:ribosomal protein S8